MTSPSNLPPSARPTPEPSATLYGLIEEEFAHNDFQLLVICSFLNRTRGDRAIPAARRFLSEYPNPEKLAKAKYSEVKIFFDQIGLFRRATWLIDLATEWLVNPPKAGKTKKKYRKGEVTIESEVAHLKGVGAYANDAWRVFCKDKMYEKAGIKTEGPEWKTVRPNDKELKAYLKWRWSTEGYDWNPETGIAVKRTSKNDIGDLGMGRLTIREAGKSQRPTQVRVLAIPARA